jgi:hypothetical protein
MKLGTAILNAIERHLSGLTRKVGTVTGTSGTKVIVTVDGNSVTIPRLASYTPVVVGDIVHIDTTGDSWLVLGKSA